jgi:hypothetical protein
MYRLVVVNSSPLYFSVSSLCTKQEGEHVRHKLGCILVEYIERTDTYSTLRGPPRDTVFFSHTSIDITYHSVID